MAANKNLLKKGDVIALNASHSVYAQIPSHKAFINSKSKKLVSSLVEQLVGDFEYLQGEYVVTKTECGGGGHGHGQNDYYPDGYKVFCQKVDGSEKVSFYQTGCFTAMITDIKPIRQAK